MVAVDRKVARQLPFAQCFDQSVWYCRTSGSCELSEVEASNGTLKLVQLLFRVLSVKEVGPSVNLGKIVPISRWPGTLNFV